jgi:hypothetical protein
MFVHDAVRIFPGEATLRTILASAPISTAFAAGKDG